MKCHFSSIGLAKICKSDHIMVWERRSETETRSAGGRVCRSSHFREHLVIPIKSWIIRNAAWPNHSTCQELEKCLHMCETYVWFQKSTKLLINKGEWPHTWEKVPTKGPGSVKGRHESSKQWCPAEKEGHPRPRSPAFSRMCNFYPDQITLRHFLGAYFFFLTRQPHCLIPGVFF